MCSQSTKNSNTIPKNCEYCGSQFLARVKRVEKGKDRFCSIICAGKGRRNGPEISEKTGRNTPVICEVCGTAFMGRRNRIKKGYDRFCSMGCFVKQKATSITLSCPQCGKDFRRKPCEMKRYPIHFCSLKCRADYQSPKGGASLLWRGGTHKGHWTAEYRQWRTSVFTRDNFTCQECGWKKGGILNAHHIQPWAKYPKLRHEITNGITLCVPCHRKRHAAKK